MTLEEALVAVWRQVLVEEAPEVELGGRRFPVHRTAKRRLRQVDFEYEGQPLRGIEQNPETSSRWAELARRGQKILQFTIVEEGAAQARGRFIGNLAEGKVTLYSSARVIRSETAEARPRPSRGRRGSQ